MKAPDKIYISIGAISSNIPDEQYALPGWHEKPNPKTANEIYIRKDALLEWAKHMNELYPAGAFQMMIDKLNNF